MRIKTRPEDMVSATVDAVRSRKNDHITHRQTGKLGDLFRERLEGIEFSRALTPVVVEQIEVDITQTPAYWKSVWEE